MYSLGADTRACICPCFLLLTVTLFSFLCARYTKSQSGWSLFDLVKDAQITVTLNAVP